MKERWNKLCEIGRHLEVEDTKAVDRACKHMEKVISPLLPDGESIELVKTCNTCHKVKSLTEFYYRSDTKNYRHDCKACKIAEWAGNNK